MAVIRYEKEDRDFRLSDHFTVGGLWLNNELDHIMVDGALVELLEQFARRFGSTPRFLSKNALYRTPKSNESAGGAEESQHVQGRAADFTIDGVTPLELARYAEVLGAGGIGMYSSGAHIHADVRAGEARWWLRTSGSNTSGFGGVPTVFKRGHRSLSNEMRTTVCRAIEHANSGPFDGVGFRCSG